MTDLDRHEGRVAAARRPDLLPTDETEAVSATELLATRRRKVRRAEARAREYLTRLRRG
ncbi:MAG TPA: hypothetical protein VHE08_04755 [Solirubrobacterales bacterium]|nr:hypothetical protein [Solirubrobacterales bacterium]